MAKAARAIAHKMKGRTATVRPSETFTSCNAGEDSLIGQRAQRLALLFGLTELRARTIANLAWEAHGHG